MSVCIRFSTVLLISLSTCVASSEQERYTYKPGDPNGIDKWYMGRQIAQVMSHYGIDWLERKERDEEENTGEVLKNLDVRPGMNVADIGAGSGYYSVRIAKQLDKGKVYAVDVAPEMIRYMDERIKKEKLENMVTVLGTERSVNLPSSSIDLMFLVDVYHELSFPYEMGLSMFAALKPGGRLILVEFRAEDASIPIKQIHKMTEKQCVLELTAAGFSFEKNIGNLPWQHFLVFRKK